MVPQNDGGTPIEARRVTDLSRDNIRKIFGLFLLVSFVFLGFCTPVGKIWRLPNEITLFEGGTYTLPVGRTVQAVQTDTEDDRLEIARDDHELALAAREAGESSLLLQLAGIPAKKIDVRVLKDFKVVPGGQSIGVKIHSRGVLVVGLYQLETARGKLSPGEEAGIQIGDLITEINGKTISSIGEIAPLVQEAGEKGTELEITLQRNHETIKTKLRPEREEKENKYKLGLYIRDSAAGIGTLTFYEPQTKRYGALGHVISDIDTKMPIVVKDGYIVPSRVTSIQKGKDGVPGEKLARFISETEIAGTIQKNNQFGIFGTLKKELKNGIMDDPIPVGLSHEVKKGPAQILTVVDHDKVEAFDIEIINSTPQKFPATKGLVIKITDPKLLDKTGGIVQGMSGSPIIQDGKLIGAVTHVFVNDQTSGYGVHIEWMLNEAGFNLYEEEMEQAS